MIRFNKVTTFRIVGLLIALVITILLMFPLRKRAFSKTIDRDFQEIRSEGVIRILIATDTVDNSNNLNTRFGLTLASEIIDRYGLNVELIPDMGYQNNIKLLKDGKCDIIAIPSLSVESLDSTILFVPTKRVTSLRLVQKVDSKTVVLKSMSEIPKNSVFIIPSASDSLILDHVVKESGKQMQFKYAYTFPIESIYKHVSEVDSTFTICHMRDVDYIHNNYKHLNCATDISIELPEAITVRRKSVQMKDSIQAIFPLNIK